MAMYWIIHKKCLLSVMQSNYKELQSQLLEHNLNFPRGRKDQKSPADFPAEVSLVFFRCDSAALTHPLGSWREGPSLKGEHAGAWPPAGCAVCSSCGVVAGWRAAGEGGPRSPLSCTCRAARLPACRGRPSPVHWGAVYTSTRLDSVGIEGSRSVLRAASWERWAGSGKSTALTREITSRLLLSTRPGVRSHNPNKYGGMFPFCWLLSFSIFSWGKP